MFDESQVKVILQRAVELDTAKGGRLTREELLQVGAEVGVSRDSLEEAIEEQRLGAAASPGEGGIPMRLSVLRLMNVSTAIGIAGGLLTSTAFWPGLRGIPMGTGVTVMLCFGALVMLSGGLALSDSTKPLRRYFGENTGVWAGFGFGGVLASALITKFGSVMTHPEWVLNTTRTSALIGFVVTTLVGSALLAIRRASASRQRTLASDSATRSGPGGPPSVVVRVVSALRRWATTSWNDYRSKRTRVAVETVSQAGVASAF